MSAKVISHRLHNIAEDTAMLMASPHDAGHEIKVTFFSLPYLQMIKRCKKPRDDLYKQLFKYESFLSQSEFSFESEYFFFVKSQFYYLEWKNAVLS